MKAIWTVLLLAVLQASAQSVDWKSIPLDVIVPAVTQGAPAPGRRVPQTTAGWECTEVHHLLTLPADWRPGQKYPVLIEYAGNGYYADARGDTCDGSVEGCVLGYGISAGKGMIWASLPFVESKNGITQNAPKWWGDIEESKRYTRETVRDICARYGGDPQRVILCGFSRGSIGCNFIGLHDDDIAALWCGFVCHSHYDGVSARWPYEGASQAAALARLKRLGNRPQWISHEGSTSATEKWLQSTGVKGNWTFVPMTFPNHSSAWVLRDMPERQKLREWVARLIKAVP
jgi:hypothetical protein